MSRRRRGDDSDCVEELVVQTPSDPPMLGPAAADAVLRLLYNAAQRQGRDKSQEPAQRHSESRDERRAA